jgi:hypothetical protein
MKGFSFINATYVQGIIHVDLTSLNFVNKCYWGGWGGVYLQPSAESENVTATDTDRQWTLSSDSSHCIICD